MTSSLQLMTVFVFGAILLSSLPIQSAFSETGFTNTKKATGVIMKFCENHAITLQDCIEKYDGYTWTDRVNVIIWAPGWNTDDNKLEQIGESFGNKITITTREDSVTSAVFTETGPDTGVFFGVVKLTGQHFTVHDQNQSLVKGHGHLSTNYGEVITGYCNPSSSSSGGHGHGFLFPLIKLQHLLFTAFTAELIPSAYAQSHGHMTHTPDCGDGVTGSAMDVAARLPTDLQNGAVTVSWEPNEDVIVQKSATWTWRTGEISFDKDVYTVSDQSNSHYMMLIYGYIMQISLLIGCVYTLILIKVESLYLYLSYQIMIMVHLYNTVVLLNS